MNTKLRIGNGYDIHKLKAGRKLVLGGVQIPHYKGLFGHSDADVLLHAIMDAMLGAAALGDIGQHFPPGDSKYKNISSIELIKQTHEIIKEDSFKIVNIDSIIMAEKPKLAPHILDIRINIAKALDIELKAVSVKATTFEGMGPVGEEKAIAASAVVLLDRY